jgi:hypothetical protein
MQPNGSYLQTMILRAIADIAGVSTFDREKPILVIEQLRSDDWASATFIGATHRFDLRLEGDRDAVAAAVQALVAALPDRDIPLAGHIVAEIAVTPQPPMTLADNMVSNMLTVNALTIVD